MKPIIKILAAWALLLGTFSQPAHASAAEVFKFKGRSAIAFFNSVDASGCFAMWGDIGAVEETLHRPPGKSSPSGLVFAFVNLFNLCTDTRVVNAFGTAPLSKSDLKIAGNLDSVRLTTTITVFDQISGSSFDLFIDLTWTATGEIIRERFHETVNMEGCHFNVHSHYGARPAQASGTVSDGKINFTLEPSVSATIFSWKGGEVSHGCDG